MNRHFPGSKEQSPSNPVRRIWLPKGKHSIPALIVLAVGLVVSFGLFAAVAAIAIEFFWLDQSNNDVPMHFMIVAGLVGIAGMIGWIVQFARIRRNLSLRNKKSRICRLDGLHRHSKFKERLPHRWLERELLARGWNRNRIVKSIADYKEGITVVVNGPTLCKYARPIPTSGGFEPIALADSWERLLALLESNLRAQGLLNDTNSRRDDQRENRSREYRHMAKYHLRRLVGPLLLAVLILDAIYAQDGDRLMVVVGLMIVSLMYFWPEVMGRQWYLVPGGLIFREYRSWRKISKVGLVTPDNSPLLVHYAESYGLVRVRGRIVKFECLDWSGWCVLAAWISTAPRPTKEEILAFFGPDAEWEGT